MIEGLNVAAIAFALAACAATIATVEEIDRALATAMLTAERKFWRSVQSGEPPRAREAGQTLEVDAVPASRQSTEMEQRRPACRCRVLSGSRPNPASSVRMIAPSKLLCGRSKKLV